MILFQTTSQFLDVRNVVVTFHILRDLERWTALNRNMNLDYISAAV
jgi:hypothetical protein